MSYRLARTARRNLQEISDYWTAEAGPEAALKVLNAVMETIIALSSQPRAGVVAEQFGKGVRKLPAGKYMIYYRAPKPTQVEILHVFHGAREQRRAWIP
ncbi:MAG: type II toxin-antitoxin system RelE/ParE family toxin [Terriglobia bacterium]